MPGKGFSAKRDKENGGYDYRGYRIYLRDGVPRGYAGRWGIGASRGFTTLREAKAYIDSIYSKS